MKEPVMYVDADNYLCVEYEDGEVYIDLSELQPRERALVGAAGNLSAIMDLHERIGLTWSVGDVMEMRKDLTEEQAKQVLAQVDRNKDASQGINWDTIEATADDMFERPRDYDEKYT